MTDLKSIQPKNCLLCAYPVSGARRATEMRTYKMDTFKTSYDKGCFESTEAMQRQCIDRHWHIPSKNVPSKVNSMEEDRKGHTVKGRLMQHNEYAPPDNPSSAQ